MEQIIIEWTVNKWMVYIIVVAIFISFISNLLGLYQRYLDNKIEKFNNKETGLLKCPFCGFDAKIKACEGSTELFWAKCSNEFCHALPECEGDSIAEVIEMWNGRN